MKLLWLAHNDYANSGFWFAQAMARAGHECRYFKEVEHQFHYAEEGRVLRGREWDGIVEQVAWADVVHVIQSDLPIHMGGEHPPLEFWIRWRRALKATVLIGMLRPSYHRAKIEDRNFNRELWLDHLRQKRVVVLHGGSFYRHLPDLYREWWDGVADKHICYSADLMGVQDNEILILPPIDTDSVTPQSRKSDKLTIGHFPSNAKIKGTEAIMAVVDAIRATGRDGFEFRCSTITPGQGLAFHVGCETVEWADQLHRTGACDVVIDQLMPVENGKPFGEWVSQATEASAMGCITITNSHNREPYRQTYGEYPALHVCNTTGELRDELDRLITLPRRQIDEEQREMREWAVRCHGYERTAKIMEDQVYSWA